MARAVPDLGHPPEIPPEARAKVAALLETGRLHRYGEQSAGQSQVAELEQHFAEMIGRRYAVAVNSCGSAMFLALKGAGVTPGTGVLLNAFTLAPVLGAIDHVGAKPVLVDITDDLTIDLDDLHRKALASGARHLLLSHMRGHICDMDALTRLCCEIGITLIEDCAHTLGGTWAGRPTGGFGLAGCFSFQSAKHVNTGEGGVLVTDDPDLAAQAILHSGSYMLYDQNGTLPPQDVMARWAPRCGNYSMRMSNLVATLALAQLPLVPARVTDWNRSHDRIAAQLAAHPAFALPHRPEGEGYAQSSLQFMLPWADAAQMRHYVQAVRARGLMVKWFGIDRPEGYTSSPAHWAGVEADSVPRACAIQQTLCDIRLPLGLSAQDCDQIAALLLDTVRKVYVREENFGNA